MYIEEPPFSRWLFGSSAAAWIWLVARLWLGYEWLHAGWEKVQSPAWMDGGKALQGFIKGAIAASKDPEHPQVAYGWWVSFLNWVNDNASWMAKLVAVGETVIGICLILGLLTGIMAFEMLHSMWGHHAPTKPSGMVAKFIAENILGREMPKE